MSGCALCGDGRTPHRLDLTFGEVDPKDTTDYQVTSLLRGVLLCQRCVTEGRLADVLNLQIEGISIIRGCLVQCAGHPPWWLRKVLPGGPRAWRKVPCPACSGKATVQLVTEAVERPPGAFREALGQIGDLFRRGSEEYEDDGDYVDSHSASGILAAEAGDFPPEHARVEDGDERQGGAAGAGVAVDEVQGSAPGPSIIIGGEAQ